MITEVFGAVWFPGLKRLTLCHLKKLVIHLKYLLAYGAISMVIKDKLYILRYRKLAKRGKLQPTVSPPSRASSFYQHLIEMLISIRSNS